MTDDSRQRFVAIRSAFVRRDVEYLRAALRDPDWRGVAARHLADLDAHEAIPELIRLLDVAKATDRVQAAKALSRLRATEAVPRLTEMAASDPVDATRSYATVALGRIGDPRSIAPLTRLLEDPEPWIRVAATKALARFGNADANAALDATRRRERRLRWRYRLWRAARAGRRERP